MRILHAPTNPADQAGIVVRALRKLGHDAELWHYGPAPFEFPADRIIDIEQKDAGPLAEALRDAVDRFDVFHFWYGRSLLPYGWGAVPPLWDLPFLKALGKKVFCTYVGSDVRMRAVQERYNPWASSLYADFAPDDDQIAKFIGLMRAYADQTFALAPELRLHAPHATQVPRAIDLMEWPARPPRSHDVPIVLHAPSHRGMKGTGLILGGLDRLKAQGVRFELRLIEGMTHTQLQDEMYNADVVVDQLLIGDFGITTVEAMASGCVAVVYLLDEVRAASPDLPAFDVSPDTFEARMRALLTDRSLRTSLAGRGRAYVEANFDSLSVAKRYLVHYESPSKPSRSLSFPDWVALGGDRRVEALEARVAELELARAQAAERAEVLAARAERLKNEFDRARRSLRPGALIRRIAKRGKP